MRATRGFALLAALFLSPLAAAQAERAWPSGSFVVRARAIYPVAPDMPEVFAPGTLIVRDGRIAAVGADLPLPPDLPVIDLSDEVLVPGFVAAAGSVVFPHAGVETASGAYRALDAYDPFEDFREQLARGTTTTHLDAGGHRLISGRGAVVKLAGAPDRRTLRADSDLCVNLGVFNPPPLIEPPFYASSDVAIEPAEFQRPQTRVGQLVELEAQLAAVRARAENPLAPFNMHEVGLLEAWNANLPIRMQARRAADLDAALRFLSSAKRAAYLVGVVEGDRLADDLLAARLPLVLRVETPQRGIAPNLGPDPAAWEPTLDALGRIARRAAAQPELAVALAGAENDWSADLHAVASLAVSGGFPRDRALAAITAAPARILGIADRVGSLAPGRDADFVALNGRPLDSATSVRHVFVSGQNAWSAPHKEGTESLVVRAGAIWVGDGHLIQGGSILIENGRIKAVGSRVATPPAARVIDAGPTAFVTPGFIDAHGHLGLGGDQSVAGPDVKLARLFAYAGPEILRVARGGVTTVLMTAYRAAPNGARIAAVKTAGDSYEKLVARDLAGVKFSIRGGDPLKALEPVKAALDAARKYEEQWKKYAEELEKWKKERDAGKATRAADTIETVVAASGPDPITGTWDIEVSGGPLPEPQRGVMKLKLTGTSIEGRLSTSDDPEEAVLKGTLNDKDVMLEIDEEIPGIGKPTIRATLTAEDVMAGSVELGALFKLDFSARRTDKSAVEFKVERRRKREKDGRPAAPKVDENLEPLRPVLAGKAPLLLDCGTAAEIRAALRMLVDEYKLQVVLLGAEDVIDVPDELKTRKDRVGVVLPREVQRRRDRKLFNQYAAIADLGVPTGLQSGAEDGARALPQLAGFAVRQGLGGDAALRALTIDAARMFKLDDRLGSLEPGKDADLLIFSGHPFDGGARLERVIVNGREVSDVAN